MLVRPRDGSTPAGGGKIDKKEFARLAASVGDFGGTEFTRGNYKDLIQQFSVVDKDHDGGLTFDEFLEIDRAHPSLFFPVMQLQHNFRRRTLGPLFAARTFREVAAISAARRLAATPRR